MISEMEFDLEEDGESFEVNVLALARRYEKRYFPEMQPIAQENSWNPWMIRHVSCQLQTRFTASMFLAVREAVLHFGAARTDP